MSASSTSIETITLHAADGYALAATRFSAQGACQGNLIVASATGAPQRFYKRFAEYASQHGFNVLTLDYRGVGQSRPQSLKGFAMNYSDWAALDLAAAVDFMSNSELPLYWLGHSFGGHALGLLPNHEKITAAYCFATGAGWAGWMPWREALKVRFMWSVLLPPIVKRTGFMAWSKLGMGEDMPLGVYRDWKHWCSYPNYFFGDASRPELSEQFAKVRMPCVFANASDDLWALPASREAFIKHYRNADIARVDLDASQRSIGHMGYFKASCSDLWDNALSWFCSQQTAPAHKQSA